MHHKLGTIVPVETVGAAINFVLDFYVVGAEVAALGRDLPLDGLPPCLVEIYRRLGGLLECSLSAPGYPPLRGGCNDLEFPRSHHAWSGTVIMGDSQGVSEWVIPHQNDNRLYVIHPPEIEPVRDWSIELETFLIDWLIEDLSMRMRWRIAGPDIGPRLGHLVDRLPVLRRITMLDPLIVYAISPTIIAVERPEQGLPPSLATEPRRIEIGAFVRPNELPDLLAGMEVSPHPTWGSDTRLDQWEALVHARSAATPAPVSRPTSPSG